MQKISNILILSLMLVFLFSLSSVCAEDNSNKNITQINDNIDTNTDTHLDSINEDIEKDESKILCSTITNSSKNNDKLTKNKENIKKQQKSEDTLSTDNEENDYTYHINSSNIGHYFDQKGIINRGFEESILIFDGEFINQGILTINSPNVNIIGNNTLFNNTVFCLESNNILLNGLNFVLDQEFYDNDYAGILILGDNNTVYNCTMNYTVPDNCNGYCVYVEGTNDYNINGFQLINNTFNFKGNNNNEVYDYGVFVDYVDNALVYGNIINAELPLRAVDWSKEIFAGVRMDYVGAFVAETSQNLILTNNHITTKVIGIKNILPTLDTVIIYDCNNSVIESNYIYSEDFISKDGKANYLQGIDLYISSNVTIINNQIHMRTTGGCEKHGTAYPIQVTGPANNITIAYNNLSSVNKGPNLGIYAHNFYGETRLYIISNYINVTGLAGNDSWALVAGIEVQDSDDLIWNNTIYVTNIGDYDDENNVYGISYSQNTENNHTYNI